MAGKSKMSLEDIQAEIARLQKQAKRMEAMESLHEHDSIKHVTETIQAAMEQTEADEISVRIAELKNSSMDLSEYYRELKKTVDGWMEDHATYRNPDNPDEYWYSPDGKGNPPKWLTALIGKKPKKGGDMNKWLENAEMYKVQTKEKKKAA
jgi:hypothetical protein